MSQTGKILLGIATILPFILWMLGILSFFPSAFHAPPDDVSHPAGVLWALGVSTILLILTVVGSLALFVYYLVHVINNPRLDSNSRLIWALVILFFANIGFIVYWLFQIWREEDDRVSHDYLN